MRVYFDPSALVPLYIEEAASVEIRAFVLHYSVQVLLNELQELELKNAIRQKVLRQEIAQAVATQSLHLLDDDLVTETVMLKPVVWPAVYAAAEKLSRRLAIKRVCRSFDLLHVAIAVVSEVKLFATLDADQASVARAAKLRVVELSMD